MRERIPELGKWAQCEGGPRTGSSQAECPQLKQETAGVQAQERERPEKSEEVWEL